MIPEPAVLDKAMTGGKAPEISRRMADFTSHLRLNGFRIGMTNPRQPLLSFRIWERRTHPNAISA